MRSNGCACPLCPREALPLRSRLLQIGPDREEDREPLLRRFNDDLLECPGFFLGHRSAALAPARPLRRLKLPNSAKITAPTNPAPCGNVYLSARFGRQQDRSGRDLRPG